MYLDRQCTYVCMYLTYQMGGTAHLFNIPIRQVGHCVPRDGGCVLALFFFFRGTSSGGQGNGASEKSPALISTVWFLIPKRASASSTTTVLSRLTESQSWLNGEHSSGLPQPNLWPLFFSCKQKTEARRGRGGHISCVSFFSSLSILEYTYGGFPQLNLL